MRALNHLFHDLDLDEYEIVEEGKPYRVWCVPAEVLNRFPPAADRRGDLARLNSLGTIRRRRVQTLACHVAETLH
ncbi:MAG TPA: hypothetical protein VNB87_14295 [Propionibacteriaceae bacterium]|jgi:hypothetical protein|nr:hypothetical protein [Propionibacteriaceae bacterium]